MALGSLVLLTLLLGCLAVEVRDPGGWGGHEDPKMDLGLPFDFPLSNPQKVASTTDTPAA